MEETFMYGSSGDSMSRILDNRVRIQEMRWGYEGNPPLMGHENQETKNQMSKPSKERKSK